jgi:serine/threonine protein kinase
MQVDTAEVSNSEQHATVTLLSKPEQATNESTGCASNQTNDMIVLATQQEYVAKLEEARQENKVVVIKYVSEQCKMCRAMAPKLQRVADRFPGIEFYSIAFKNETKSLFKQVGVKELPYIEVFAGSQGKISGLVCSSGKIADLLRVLESVADFEQTRDTGPDLPSTWKPYITNIEEVGSGNFGKVFSMDLTCPDGQVTKVAMKDLTTGGEMNKQLRDTEVQAIRELSDFLSGDQAVLQEKLGSTDDFSAYCDPLLAEPLEQDGHLYLPMPFCNQGEFRDIYANSTKRASFGGTRAMYAFLLHIAKGVKAFHAAGWVHNDLHGRNVMVTCGTDELDKIPDSCYASIIDLGLASKMDKMVAGMRGYRYSISPEVISMRKTEAYPNPKSDVWELGMLLWEIRLGRDTLPTMAESMDEVIALIPTLDFKDAPFEELEGEPEIQNLLRGMLTQNASERWDLDRAITELEKVALPEMLGPHQSAWLNAGCLLESIIPDGSIVELHGMTSATELNGLSGEVVQYDSQRKAYTIRLNDGTTRVTPGSRIRVIE